MSAGGILSELVTQQPDSDRDDPREDHDREQDYDGRENEKKRTQLDLCDIPHVPQRDGHQRRCEEGEVDEDTVVLLRRSPLGGIRDGIYPPQKTTYREA